MTWSYSNNPSGNPIDEVRLLIGDTDIDDQQLTNEEIQYYIDTYGPGVRAAIPGVQGLIAKYSRLVDQTTGEIQVKWSQRVSNWEALLDQLKDQLRLRNTPRPFAGGVSKDDINNREEDADRVKDTFAVGIDDNIDFRP